MLKICTSEYMVSDSNGLRMRSTFYPRPVAESFLVSKKDGEISRAPDAVTMIEGDVTYANTTPDGQWVHVRIHKGPRTIVTTDPNTVLIHDAWSWARGVDPQADYPSVYQDTFGGRLQRNRPSVEPDKLAYGRLFLSCDDSQAWATIGEVPPGEAMHFRYLAAVETPGTWIVPTEVEPRYEAYANWCRLTAFAAPLGSL